MLYLTARHIIPEPIKNLCGVSWDSETTKTVAAIRVTLAALGALAIYKLGISSLIAVGAVAITSLPAAAILGGSLLMYKGIVTLAVAGSLKSLALGWITLSLGGSCLALYQRASSLKGILEAPSVVTTQFTIPVSDEYNYSMGLLEAIFRNANIA